MSLELELALEHLRIAKSLISSDSELHGVIFRAECMAGELRADETSKPEVPCEDALAEQTETNRLLWQERRELTAEVARLRERTGDAGR